MNIKLKAVLITLTILVGIFGGVYTVFLEPLVLGIIAVLILFYGMYHLVLDSLEKKQQKDSK